MCEEKPDSENTKSKRLALVLDHSTAFRGRAYVHAYVYANVHENVCAYTYTDVYVNVCRCIYI